jgi:energy-coupling factor transporter ATP-binding protein EcfA2
LIGRERECDVLRDAVVRVVEGGSAFVLLVGEPGIGKSTLLTALSVLARESGFAVGFGRGQSDGAVPLWPWRSAVASVATERGQSVGKFSGPLDDPPVERHAQLQGGGSERFAIFERIARHLTVCAAQGPIALLLDDLQWAEVTALRLLTHLVHRPSLPGVLIAGALRTTEPLAPDVDELVGEVLAHPVTDVVEVSGFDACEVTAFAEAASPRRLTDAEIGVLVRRSGGNPFLLGELLRWVPSRGSAVEFDAALPLAVRESVRRRLVVEKPVTQRVLKAAAVAGPVASLNLLASVTGVDRIELAEALDAAVRAGLLVGHPDGCDPVSFVHDLVREAVLSMLPTWDRFELHHAIGMALVDDVRSSNWAAVAAHLTAARPLVADATLAVVARRAAVEATRAGAFDEAAAHLAVALEVTEPGGDAAGRGELLWERGRVLWAAERAEESKQVLGEASALARRTGNGELLARVALSWRGGELRPILRQADHQFLALLREALTACPPGDSRLRCLLLASWARCAYWDIGDRDGIAACDEAVAMARRLGDPEAVTNALGTLFYYRWRPELVRERLAIAAEILAVAVAAGDPSLVAEARYFRLVAHLDLGWLRDAWSELDRFEVAVAVSGQPTLKLRALWFRATRHLALGDRKRADEVAAEACALAERMGHPDAAVEHVGQSLLLRASEGRVEEAVRLVSPGLLGPVAYNAVVAVANGLGGRPVEARASLDAVVAAGLERFPHDMSWLFTRCGLLAAAVVSGDRDTGELLYDALRPFAGQWVVLNPGIMVVGAVDHYLGLGAALLGRLDGAVDHLRRAADAHADEGAVALALLSLHELSTVLGSRHESGDDAEIGAVGQRITRLAARNTVPFKPLLPIAWSATDATLVPEHRQRLVLDGDTWLVEFAGGRARLRDQRGLHHLRTLLGRPGVEIPALALAGGDGWLAGSTDGTVLDEQAMRAYRQRIIDLQEDIDEATSNNDTERAARAEAELDAFVQQLASATGLGGRPRRFAGADERARVSVTKAIRAAIKHLGEQLPDLGRHLAATVHTGSRCVYQPDPRIPHRWTTERV